MAPSASHDDPLADNRAAGDGLMLIYAGAIAGFEAVALAGGEGHARPGALAVADGRVIAAGTRDEIDRAFAADATRHINCPDRVVLPGLINAHTHLELTAIGPQPYGGDFIGWVSMLRQHPPPPPETDQSANMAAWFAASAAQGVAQSKAAGVQAVGDITRFDAVAQARRVGGLGGVSFLEVLGMGPPWDEAALDCMADPGEADGFQPHAPYSAGPALFDAACESGLPLSSHAAETLDEARFIAEGDGPFLELLKTLGKWSPEFATRYGQGLSPVRWLEPYLRRTPWLLAHCNYVSDDDIALLAETQTSVAYCPIASEYFGHHATGPTHRYREMLEAGVNVCLGTDSIVCQPPSEIEPQPLGMLPVMRRLFQRDRTDPALLLRMATAHGRRALQLNDRITRLATIAFNPDDPTDALTQVLSRRDPVQEIELQTITLGRK